MGKIFTVTSYHRDQVINAFPFLFYSNMRQHKSSGKDNTHRVLSTLFSLYNHDVLMKQAFYFFKKSWMLLPYLDEVQARHSVIYLTNYRRFLVSVFAELVSLAFSLN